MTLANALPGNQINRLKEPKKTAYVECIDNKTGTPFQANQLNR